MNHWNQEDIHYSSLKIGGAEKLLSKQYHNLLKNRVCMNIQPYAMPKQLFRTSCSPSFQTIRPSSLNTPTLSSNHIGSSPIVRFEQSNGSSILREPPKNGLSGSQASFIELHKKPSNQDYYPEQKGDDMMKTLSQKM